MKKLLLFSLIAMVAVMAGYSQQKAVLWSEDFEGDWTVNWHVDAGTWEVGTPTSGPGAAHGGQKLAATVLAGNYSEPLSTRLIRHTTFLVPAATEHPRLRFYSWFNFSAGDYGEVQIKVGNAEWKAISGKYNNLGSDAWSYGLIDLSEYAGSMVQIGFYFYSVRIGLSSNVSTGWYLDDVSLITGPYVLNIPEGFESGYGDWSVDEGSWEVGEPNSGPSSAHSGSNCAGTNLEGNYQESAEGRLISPPFVVPAATEHPRFRFYSWFNFSAGDYGEVQIKVGNAEWKAISGKYNNLGSDAWSYGLIDLSEYAGSMVQIGFYFYSVRIGLSSNVSTGWYLDDVSLITGPYVLNITEGFESGYGDWSVDEGSWEVGEPNSGPSSAHSGSNCAGTNLEGNYQESAEGRLISPPFVVPAATEHPRFRFYSWFSFSASDYGEVQIKVGNADWKAISGKYNNLGSDAWSYGLIDLSDYEGSTVQIGFYFYSIREGLSSNVSTGWYIDDISLVTGPYVLNITEGFESGYGDWSVGEGSWEVGVPNSGPSSAHSGSNCAGTNLEGNYQESAEGRLISPPFVVPETGENSALRFWHWFSFSSGDYGEVQISMDGGTTWESISSQFINNSSGAWSPFYVSLSNYANKKVRIAYYFYSVRVGLSSNTSSGWYIDDINFDNINWVRENEIQKLNIYPNPFSEKTTIQFDDINLSGYRLSVYNISGTKVLEMKDIRSDKIELEKGSLPAGIYIIELKGNKVYRNKIIIR